MWQQPPSPQIIILRYTGIPLQEAKDDSLRKGYRCHYIVDVTGAIVSQASERIRLHTLPKQTCWGSIPNVNLYALVVEVVNLGESYGYVPESITTLADRQGGWFGSAYRQVSLGWFSIQQQLGKTAPVLGKSWAPYPDRQILAVKNLLADLMSRYEIEASNVIGLSDVQPQGPLNPGPKFPWSQVLPEALVKDHPPEVKHFFSRRPDKLSIEWVQEALIECGYHCPKTRQIDNETLAYLYAFQAHYSPSNLSGFPDKKTIDMLENVLVERKLERLKY